MGARTRRVAYSMSCEQKQAFLPLFTQIYKNDTAAIELSFMLLDVAHTWDDLVDKDKRVSKDDIDKAFLYSLQCIPMHKYWTPAMHSMLTSVYLRWHAANEIESDVTSTEDDIAKAWMLRASLYDLFEMLTLQIHGIDWAKQCARTLRLYYGEKLTNFTSEVMKCRTQQPE